VAAAVRLVDLADRSRRGPYQRAVLSKHDGASNTAQQLPHRSLTCLVPVTARA
jgi:hypothetical protein